MLKRSNLSDFIKCRSIYTRSRLSSRLFSSTGVTDHQNEKVPATAAHGKDDLDPDGKHYFGTNLVKFDEPHQRYYIMLGAKEQQTNIPVEAVPPTPRTFVEWNGRKYPYPYRGLWEEEKGPEVMKWIVENNYVDPENGLLRVHKIDKKYRTKVLQYWFQTDNGMPSYLRTTRDSMLFRLVIYIMFYIVLSSFYMSYNFITPKEKNVFLYENWKRWNYEHH